jgi:hypothetical protein
MNDEEGVRSNELLMSRKKGYKLQAIRCKQSAPGARRERNHGGTGTGRGTEKRRIS